MVWIEKLKQIVKRLQELGPEESWTGILLALLNLCEQDKIQEARKFTEERYEHLNYAYYGLLSSSFSAELSPEMRRVAFEMSELIEEAQSLLVRNLEVCPRNTVNPFFVGGLR